MSVDQDEQEIQKYAKKLGLNKTHNKKSFKKSLLTDGLDDLFNWADDFENSSFGQKLIGSNSKVKRKKSSKTVDDLLVDDDDNHVAAKKHKKETTKNYIPTKRKD